MDIYPRDLGEEEARQLLQYRLGFGGAEARPQIVVGMRGRALIRRRSQPLWPYLLGSLFVALWLVEMFNLNFLLVELSCATVVLLLHQAFSRPMSQAPRQPWSLPEARQPEARLTVREIQMLIEDCSDPLRRQYLELIGTAVTLPRLEHSLTNTEVSIRKALRALGNAIEALPAKTLSKLPDDPARLRAATAILVEEAQRESDPVIIASLQRRIEAVTRQAETMARVSIILRRNQALRLELGDQISALQTSLAASMLGEDPTGPELADLAANIQRVAQEANAITAARVEVDTLAAEPWGGATLPTAEEARAINRH